jgi:hypothetical protein
MYDNGVVIRRDIEEFWTEEEKDGQNVRTLNTTIKYQDFTTGDNIQPLDYAFRTIQRIFS